MFVTYKLSEKSLNKLQKKGVSETVLNDLAELKDRVYSSKESFLNRVKKLPQAQEIMKNQDDLLKTAKGFFRLDRLIPNRTIREWTEALIFAVVVATIVRTYLFAPFQIPSGSMLPTIQIGDHIFASMYSYGSPVPFTEIGSLKNLSRGETSSFSLILWILRLTTLNELSACPKKPWKFRMIKSSSTEKSWMNPMLILNRRNRFPGRLKA